MIVEDNLKKLNYGEVIKTARNRKNLKLMTMGEIEDYVRELEMLVCDASWAKTYLELLVNSAK
ncbi:MAG: hypothetical protein LBV03_07365 [Fusobacteriales bacterium]|nr:hypothetical protein [Fusobacteriales bacterium]